jgi:transposase
VKYDRKERTYALDYIENKISEEETEFNQARDIQKCIAAGVLPKCYEGTAIGVELQGQTELSCFSLNQDGTVTCPTGCILTRVKTRGKNAIYASKEACRQCPNRCTSSKSFKTVSFGPGTKYVPVRLYGSPGKKLNPLPKDVVLYNSFGRKNKPKRQVLLRIKDAPDKIHERMCLSEHPFGTVKWYDGAHYLLCKGKEKAAAELGLSFLAYNLKRAINMVGTKALIAAMQG